MKNILLEVLVDYVRNYDGIFTESDCTAVCDEIMERIEGALPSENMQHSYAYSYCMQPGMPNGEPEPDMEIYEAFCDGVEWARSCLGIINEQ